MSNEHSAAGVKEPPRQLAVVPSSPGLPSQFARTAAAAVVVPFNYSSGAKFGGP